MAEKKIYDYIFTGFGASTCILLREMDKKGLLKKKKSLEMKKKDLIRIKNIDKKIDNIKNDLYEYILLNNVISFLRTKDIRYYYTLVHLLGNNIE